MPKVTGAGSQGGQDPIEYVVQGRRRKESRYRCARTRKDARCLGGGDRRFRRRGGVRTAAKCNGGEWQKQ